MLSFRIIKIRKSEFFRTRKEKLEKTITELFNFSKKLDEKVLKDKYKDILQRIGGHIWTLKTHFTLKLKDEEKRFICRKCHTVLLPGKTLKVRNYEGYMVFECLNCGNKRRFLIKRNKKRTYSK